MGRTKRCPAQEHEWLEELAPRHALHRVQIVDQRLFSVRHAERHGVIYTPLHTVCVAMHNYTTAMQVWCISGYISIREACVRGRWTEHTISHTQHTAIACAANALYNVALIRRDPQLLDRTTTHSILLLKMHLTSCLHAHVPHRHRATKPVSSRHRCVTCAAAPDEPSVSEALSKTTDVFQLATGEAPSAAKRRVTLSRDLSDAISREDYTTAAKLRDALRTLEAADPVARLRAELQAAVQEERFEEAARLRDALKDALQSTTNLADIPVSSDTVTDNIRVRVKSFYVPQQSSPARGLYFFAYSITITNEGEDTVMLRNRHWLITDDDGQTEDVRYVLHWSIP